jgi:hypothetical protein
VKNTAGGVPENIQQQHYDKNASPVNLEFNPEKF